MATSLAQSLGIPHAMLDDLTHRVHCAAAYYRHQKRRVHKANPGAGAVEMPPLVDESEAAFAVRWLRAACWLDLLPRGLEDRILEAVAERVLAMEAADNREAA
jgi:hypothetical protein